MKGTHRVVVELVKLGFYLRDFTPMTLTSFCDIFLVHQMGGIRNINTELFNPKLLISLTETVNLLIYVNDNEDFVLNES